MRTKLTAILNLVRWPNLLIVFFTQFVVWGCLITPLKIPLHFLTFPHFLWLSLSVIFIAAGGYIINDIYDVKIDLINKPQKVIIGTKIAGKKAFAMYYFLNLLGIAIAVYLCFLEDRYLLFLLQLFSILLLWAYARYLKKSYLWGNLSIAFLTALTVLILPFYEPCLGQIPTLTATEYPTKIILNLYLIFGYAYFAFMLTWAREIVKDLQDLEGDKKNGAHTLPIVSGKSPAIRWVQFICLLIILPLFYFTITFLKSNPILISVYIFIALIIPCLAFLFRLSEKQQTVDYGKMSGFIKVIMLAGLLALPLYYLLS